MTIQECYAALGGDYQEVLSRLYSEALVQRFVGKFLSDPSFQLLEDSMKAENYDEAFRAAHTLKGVCQNLAFTKLGRSSSALTDALRDQWAPDVPSLAEEVRRDYQQTVDSIRLLKESMEP